MRPLSQLSMEDALQVRVLTVHGLACGHWEVSDSLGRIGGYFIDMKTAIRFAKFECGSALVLIAPASGAATTH